MESENEGSEDGFPFQRCDFRFHVNFPGCTDLKMGFGPTHMGESDSIDFTSWLKVEGNPASTDHHRLQGVRRLV